MEALNNLNDIEIFSELLRCCGSENWVKNMILERPFEDLDTLLDISDQIWRSLNESDWLQAFSAHPRIGDADAVRKKEQISGGKPSWEGDEQRGASSADSSTKDELRHFNNIYYEKFGFIFLICATGKSAEEMLSSLRERLNHDTEDEV